MATNDLSKVYTLPEILRATAPDGSYMPFIDILSGRYPMLEEAVWEQANDNSSHEFLQLASEPTGAPVRYNEGGPLEAVVTTPLREELMRIETNMQVDTRILRKSPNPAQYVRDRQAQYVKGLIKTMHKHAFSVGETAGAMNYGNKDADPKAINGLRKRYNSLSLVGNISNLGGATANAQSSMWLIKWGKQGVFFIHPNNAEQTITVDYKGEVPKYDASGNPYSVEWWNFAFEMGLGVADDRCVQRLCNINASGNGSFYEDAVATKGERLLIDMIERLPGGETDGCVLYAGPSVMPQIRKRINEKSNMYFNEQTIWGRKMLAFQDIPIVRVDALNALEPIVT